MAKEERYRLKAVGYLSQWFRIYFLLSLYCFHAYKFQEAVQFPLKSHQLGQQTAAACHLYISLSEGPTLTYSALSKNKEWTGLQLVRNDPYYFHHFHENFQFMWAHTKYIMYFINHKNSLTSLCYSVSILVDTHFILTRLRRLFHLSETKLLKNEQLLRKTQNLSWNTALQMSTSAFWQRRKGASSESLPSCVCLQCKAILKPITSSKLNFVALTLCFPLDQTFFSNSRIP